jgi:hypothetical protein
MLTVLEPVLRTQTDEGEELGPYQVTHLLQGISDTLFEIMYGANEELHSKAVPLLSVLFNLALKAKAQKSNDKDSSRLHITVRYLMIKLFNSIDTTKQHPLVEAVHKELVAAGTMSEASIHLALDIYLDTIKLKLGRRLSHISVIQILDSLNTILTKKNAELVRNSFSGATRELLASALGYLYYFKHQSLMQIFQNSQIDLVHSKSVFTHCVYKCCSGHLRTYFRLFLLGPKSIEANPTGLGAETTFGSILGLKTSNQSSIEFTEESHAFKFKLLCPSLVQHLMSLLKASASQDLCISSQVLEVMALFNILCSQMAVDKTPDRLSEADKRLVEQETTRSWDALSPLQKYTLSKFAFLMGLRAQVDADVVQLEFEPPRVDLKSVVEENFVLSKYALDPAQLAGDVQQLICLTNIAQVENVVYHTQMLSQARVSHAQLVQNPSDVNVLRLFFNQQRGQTPLLLSESNNSQLFKALSGNLCMNSSSLRLQTLKVLSLFTVLEYLQPDAEEEREVSENYRNRPCACVQLLLEFESLQLSFETHKAKESSLESVLVMIKSCLMPDLYVDLLYNFLVGCFWVKFTLIYENVSQCIAQLIRVASAEKRA